MLPSRYLWIGFIISYHILNELTTILKAYESRASQGMNYYSSWHYLLNTYLILVHTEAKMIAHNMRWHEIYYQFKSISHDLFLDNGVHKRCQSFIKYAGGSEWSFLLWFVCTQSYSPSRASHSILFPLRIQNLPQRAQKKALDCEDFVLRACTYNGCKRY